MDNSEKAIVRTLIYSDFFDYPLSENEIWEYLISYEKINKNVFKKKIRRINSVVFREKGLFYIKGNNSSVLKRLNRHKESLRKIGIAEKIIKKLFLIPTVLLIGISGNLSMMNAGKKDDIDIFVVAGENKIWTTRLLLILYLKILGKYRNRTDKKVSDKVCLNMIVGEDRMRLPQNLRNLYTAHEIIQLMPIMERKKSYEKFIKANKWVEDFMPNSVKNSENHIVNSPKETLWTHLLKLILNMPFIEISAKLFQTSLIKRNLTKEIIEDNFIALHPKDYKKLILTNYFDKLSKYGLQI